MNFQIDYIGNQDHLRKGILTDGVGINIPPLLDLKYLFGKNLFVSMEDISIEVCDISKLLLRYNARW